MRIAFYGSHPWSSGNEGLADHLHRGCYRIHGILSGRRKQSGRDGAGCNAGSGSERGGACAVRGGIGQTCSSASRSAWLSDVSSFRTVDGPSRNHRHSHRAQIGVAGPQDIAQPLPAARDASDDAPKAASSTQDFRYLIYYVWSEVPPAEKPAEIVLRSFKDIPVGTPVEEIKRASDAFGLDSNFMKAVAKIEFGFNPDQRTGSYIGLFQLSKYEFGKFGFGEICNPRDNAVAAAYKVITEGILFEWITHRKPDLSDLYLIHQQGWEGAAEHISQPARLAWKSMCATSEGKEKGERWCKRAIWGNALPAFKKTWKSVDNVTSEAFVGMWRARVAEFYTKYVATAAAAANP